jgi:hypothetical protein
VLVCPSCGLSEKFETIQREIDEQIMADLADPLTKELFKGVRSNKTLKVVRNKSRKPTRQRFTLI